VSLFEMLNTGQQAAALATAPEAVVTPLRNRQEENRDALGQDAALNQAVIVATTFTLPEE
jgi:hypothetical protein